MRTPVKFANLPWGWKAQYSHHRQRHVFVHKQLRLVQYTHPACDSRLARVVTAGGGCLPDGWYGHQSSEGRVYYVHHKLRLRQWTRPQGTGANAPGDSPTATAAFARHALPPGWAREVSGRSGLAYYIHKGHRISQFQHPGEFRTAAALIEQRGPLPKGWFAHIGRRGDIYYSHRRRGLRQRHWPEE